MRRVRIRKAGGYERLEIETAPDPAPNAGEVRVAVEAIGVNFADCIVRMGLYASAKEYVGWPITPGFEVAGVVDRIGEGVVDIKVGDRVIALTRFGGYATSVVVPAHQAFAIPEGWTMHDAAAFPVVFLTADYALFELAHPRKDRPSSFTRRPEVSEERCCSSLAQATSCPLASLGAATRSKLHESLARRT